MKSVVIISVVTFVLIFGGVVLLYPVGKTRRARRDPNLAPEDYAAAERVFADVAVERDRMPARTGILARAPPAIAVQEKVLDEGPKNCWE